MAYRDVISGGLYTGDATSLGPLNKPFFARLDEYDGARQTYSWTQVVESIPGTYADLPGGLIGSTLLNPAVHPDRASQYSGYPDDTQYTTLSTPSIVRLQRSYYDPVYDWVYEIVFNPVPEWQYFKPKECPNACNYYLGDVVDWDGVTELNLRPDQYGVVVKEQLVLGQRYPARLTTVHVPVTGTTPDPAECSPYIAVWEVFADVAADEACGGNPEKTTTTTFNPGTTTTQAPGSFDAGCQGKCTWTWSNTTKVWTKATDTCAPATTTTPAPTSSTSSTSTSAGASTTSSTTGTTNTTLCCPTTPAPTTTSTAPTTSSSTTTGTTGTGTTTTAAPTTTSSTTTTTTTTGNPCHCSPPSYCGTVTGEHSTTFCDFFEPLPDPCCNQTSTSSTSTTSGTTTTPRFDCSIGCDWVYSSALAQYVLVFNGCSDVCGCPAPDAIALDCAPAHTSCGPIIPTTTIGPCTGQCTWLWNEFHQAWKQSNFDCGRETGLGFDVDDCNCQPPSVPGVNDCDIATTRCGDEGGGDGHLPCNPTSTTFSPGDCSGVCRWGWTGTQWIIVSATCPFPPCSCNFPPSYAGTSVLETAETRCGTTPPPPATTATTGTTTTGCGICTWVWNVSPPHWSGPTVPCSSPACVCSPPFFSGAVGGQTAITVCAPGVPPCPTTTTPAPTCGQCTYVVQSFLVGRCIVIGIASSSCTGGCTCPDVSTVNAEVCCNAGETPIVTRNCTGTSTTTSTTTTAGCPGTTCIWTWSIMDGGHWQLTFFNCLGITGCSCHQPPYSGTFNGQQVTLTCSK